MKFILGKKLKMTQIFDAEGKSIPVTLVEAGPCFVTQEKNIEKDGYQAVQICFGKKKENKISKPLRGHLAKIPGFKTSPRYLMEFWNDNSELKAGDEIKADIFKEGDLVKVAGVSKGKGFSGVVKRHNFGGGPATHGQKHGLRAPGSIGATFPEHVPKGRRMAGRMGGGRKTVSNLEIVKIDAENNILAIKGAVPGNRGGLLEIAEM